MNRRGMGAMLIVLATLTGCGGGGDGSPVVDSGGAVTPDKPLTPKPPAQDCSPQIATGFSGRAFEADGVGINEGGGSGSDGSGGGEAGSIGAGGSLGQFRGARVRVRDPDSGFEFGQGVTDADKGMVTIRLCGYQGRLEVIFEGQEGAEYFDEALETYVPFPPGHQVRVRIANTARGLVGATPYTEAAVRYEDASADAGSATRIGATKDVATSARADANETIAAVLADQLPGVYRSSDPDGRFEITSLPVVLNDLNVARADTLTDDDRGRYGAANAGLSLLAGTFLPDDPSPALTGADQFARDLSDGNLDLVDVDGCTVAAGPASGGLCPADSGAPVAYTYETLWRGKTVATSVSTRRAGDAALAGKNADIAAFRLSGDRSYRTGVSPTSPNAMGRRTLVNQSVRLDAAGRLTLKRGSTALFGTGVWISRETEAMGIAGEFVEVKVGSRGELVALKRNRREIVYVEPPRMYLVTGGETLTPDGRDLPPDSDVLMAVLKTIETQTIDMGQAERVVTFTPSPFLRIYKDDTAGAPPAFVAVLSSGKLRAVHPAVSSGSFLARWGTPVQTDLPAPFALTAVVYDQFVPPDLDPAYGAAPSEPIELPYAGPRRLYGLSRNGRVRVWLEGATAVGRELDIPGRVVQLVAEARVGVYALNSDGKVFWINPDQAHESAAIVIDALRASSFPRRFALDSVRAVTLPERICWIARTEAVACYSGNVYQWSEDLVTIQQDVQGTNPCTSEWMAPVPSIQPAGRLAVQSVLPNSQLVKMGRGISAPVKVKLDAAVLPVWRLNTPHEFHYVQNLSGSCAIEGLSYLGVNGSSTFPVNAVSGLQLRQALDHALAEMASGPRTAASTDPVGGTGTIRLVSLPAQPGSLIHQSSIAVPASGSQAANNVPRPALEAVGMKQWNPTNNTTTLSFTELKDLTSQRTVALDGQPARFVDGDAISIPSSGVTILAEAIGGNGSEGCNTAECQDENFEAGTWRVSLLLTTDPADPTGFRLCLRLRTEQALTASVRFTCTHHDKDGKLAGISMKDWVLFPDGRRDLIEFGY